MTITFNVNLTLDLSQATKDWIMSALSDAIAKVNTSADNAIARVSNDVEKLTAEIISLQAQVASGGATPEELQALDDLQAKLDAIDPTTPAVLPT